GNYSKIYLESGEQILVSKKLKELEDLLPARMFFRIHNSYIVHLLKVDEYIRNDGYLVLSNNSKIPISRNKKDAFLHRMAQ
ncbi:MAG: LytTR family DNA-binding domain-containing protein, partial [Bacteroidota bacterium]|nr:LytTR family DNA-binding domain-containing protein [Bacteroidota bacterium]